VIVIVTGFGTIPSADASYYPYFDSEITISNIPKIGETAELTFKIIPPSDQPSVYPDYTSTIKLAPGFDLISGNLEQTIDIHPGDMPEHKVTIKAVQQGNWTIWGSGEQTRQSPLYITVSEDNSYLHDGPFPRPHRIDIMSNATGIPVDSR
jgi:hypothetical protein